MDSQKEVRSAVLAIVKAVAQKRSDFQVLLDLLHAIKRVRPEVLFVLQPIQDAEKTLQLATDDLAIRLESALENNQPFAALLQEYAELWEPPLSEHIRILKSAGFQTNVASND
jgi:hypothetical protein